MKTFWELYLGDLPLWSSSLLLSTVLSQSNCRHTCQTCFPFPPSLNMPHFVHVKTGALQGHKLKPGDKNIIADSAGRKRIRVLQIRPFRILTGPTCEIHAASHSAMEDFSEVAGWGPALASGTSTTLPEGLTDRNRRVTHIHCLFTEDFY